MIKKYKNLGNLCLGVMALDVAAIAITGNNSQTGNVWDEGGAPAILMYVMGTSIIAAFAFYAKSKGHSAWYGLLAVLNVIGLVFLLNLEDRHPLPPSEDKTANVSKVGIGVFIVIGLAALGYALISIKSMMP